MITVVCVFYWPSVAAVGNWYSRNRADLTPIGAAIGGAIVAWAALRQARTATQQAETASLRHQEQTNADRQRRITESYSKAVEQLANEKIEARLGGIYTLERISKESPDDYWTVMETLTAFVRERARWKEPDTAVMESMARYDEAVTEHSDQQRRREPSTDTAAVLTVIKRQRRREPSTDIAAVLTVIKRRDPANCLREKERKWLLDLRGTDLRGADLRGVDLERADLRGTHLERADLAKAHLEGANLVEARLEGADLAKAHLEGANLVEARLEGANLWWAHLELTYLKEAHLEGANFLETHLEGANLWGATGLTTEQLARTFGDAKTRLPAGIARPTHWPPGAPEGDSDRR